MEKNRENLISFLATILAVVVLAVVDIFLPPEKGAAIQAAITGLIGIAAGIKRAASNSGEVGK
jgi:hypothetical protein